MRASAETSALSEKLIKSIIRIFKQRAAYNKSLARQQVNGCMKNIYLARANSYERAIDIVEEQNVKLYDRRESAVTASSNSDGSG